MIVAGFVKIARDFFSSPRKMIAEEISEVLSFSTLGSDVEIGRRGG